MNINYAEYSTKELKETLEYIRYELRMAFHRHDKENVVMYGKMVEGITEELRKRGK